MSAPTWSSLTFHRKIGERNHSEVYSEAAGWLFPFLLFVPFSACAFPFSKIS
jgi:hypothetical protein